MGKLGRTLSANPNRTRGVITSEQTSTGTTHQGGAGFARDAKSELFLLAVTNFVGEDTFYEDAKGRDTRFRDLIRATAADDPRWTADLLKWLRTAANMRSASVVGAVEAARIVSEKQKTSRFPTFVGSATDDVTARSILDSVLIRADEPGEALAYWLAVYGKPLPKWLKRGLGDAARRLYTEYNFLKWDSDRNAVRFADVIEYTQLKTAKGDHSGLWKYILDRRHGRAEKIPSSLGMIANNAQLRRIAGENPAALLHPQNLRAAGLTWEDVLSLGGKKVDKKALWEAAIPQMAYFALIRNLRNFDEAGISKESRDYVASFLTNPERVEQSRLLPMRFLTAYNAAPSDFWKPVLDEAASHALRNVPTLGGNTLVLIDTSGSMNAPFSNRPLRGWNDAPNRDQLMRWDVAALFGIALAKAAKNADVVSFSSGGYGCRHDSLKFELLKGENLLASVNRFRRTHFINGGTDTAGAIRRWYNKHDRVVLLTDEQAGAFGWGGDIFSPIPANVPVYTFNLAGYQRGHAASGPNRYTVTGLSDAGFAMIDTLERRQSGKWPWQEFHQD